MDMTRPSGDWAEVIRGRNTRPLTDSPTQGHVRADAGPGFASGCKTCCILITSLSQLQRREG